MMPTDLVIDFWQTVQGELVGRHRLTGADAVKAVGVYRDALARHQVGDWVYHRDPEDVADIVAGGWRSGFPDPS